jgi:hypothetical protein
LPESLCAELYYILPNKVTKGVYLKNATTYNHYY